MNNKYLRAMRNTLFVSPDKKPYCGTCHKAGLSYEEYTSHYTRKSPDPNSEIVCPLILNALCSQCNEKGHWKKYCPKLSWGTKNTRQNTFIPIKKDDLEVEEYNSSPRNSEEGPPFRPKSPDEPPPWLESEPKPVKSWADIVSAKK
jgi:hypothetical protein